MVYNVCIWLNAFPLKSGLSMEYSPRDIVTHISVDYEKYCRSKLGSYVEASTDAMATNDQNPRTHGCIKLGDPGNRQGSLK